MTNIGKVVITEDSVNDLLLKTKAKSENLDYNKLKSDAEKIIADVKHRAEQIVVDPIDQSKYFDPKYMRFLRDNKFSGFTNEDSIRVKVWINELIKGDRKVKDNLEKRIETQGLTDYIFRKGGIDNQMDKKNNVSIAVFYFFKHCFESFFKLASILGPCHQGNHIQCKNTLIL